MNRVRHRDRLELPVAKNDLYALDGGLGRQQEPERLALTRGNADEVLRAGQPVGGGVAAEIRLRIPSVVPADEPVSVT